MKLSVIIPSYNAAATIGTQLDALISQNWSEPWEIIVSNDGSTDNTMAIVDRYRERLPKLRVIDSSDRRGRSHARNVGVLTASGDALAFCDADDEVGPGWLAAIGEALSTHDFVASRFDPKKLNLCGTPGPSEQQYSLQKIWYPPYLPHSGGGGLGVKRAVHEKVGGFDESLDVLEDTDYCFKVQLTGEKLHFVPNAIYHVRFRETYGALFHQSRLWAEYNMLLYKRYRPPGVRMVKPWNAFLKHWVRLLCLVPHAYDRHSRGRLVWILGRQIGQLMGIVKYRIHPI